MQFLACLPISKLLSQKLSNFFPKVSMWQPPNFSLWDEEGDLSDGNVSTGRTPDEHGAGPPTHQPDRQRKVVTQERTGPGPVCSISLASP